MSKTPTLRSLNMIEYRKSPRFEYAPMDISRYTRRSALQPPRIRAQAPQKSQEPQAQRQETTEQPAPAKPSSPAPSNEGVYEGLSDLVPDVLAMDRFLDSSSTTNTTNTPQATPSPAPSETQSTKQKPKEEAFNGLGQPAEEQSHKAQQPPAEEATSVDESNQGGYYMLSAAAASARLAIPEEDEEENELVIRSALKFHNDDIAKHNAGIYHGDKWARLEPLRSETYYNLLDSCLGGCELESFPNNAHGLRYLTDAEVNGILGHLRSNVRLDSPRIVKINWILERWTNWTHL
ncbi:hypothetical protein MGU_05874 [Metarhizium guizhouense ARSEF 977]|uniref:Uncharacterized protein n=1 Tax=Metarhizium guizhouense (strain ARSEF 977) TaxID=1276136 RepID=A0A0B4HBC3_METGA|nr:hypothetical protein MGU_05874 [Metarhizium guizhouense ARSEF 977]